MKRVHMKKSSILRSNQGFTLIEILLVVVIIGLLLGVAAVRLGGRQKEAAITRAAADISALGTALKLYEMDNMTYPSSEQGLQALWIKPSTPPAPRNWHEYLEKPLGNDPFHNPYVYKAPGEHHPTGYDLYSKGPDGVDGTEDDITNW